MSAIVAAPIINESMPVFQDQFGIPKDAVRWLFFPGDVMNPRRKRELKDKVARYIYFNGQPFKVLSAGGEEVGSTCLMRTKQTVPRAMFTPLEIAGDWIPPTMIPEGAECFRGAVLPEGHGKPTELVGAWNMKAGAPLPGLKVYPGEAIRSILQVAMNDMGMSKGLIEIEALIGMTWDESVREKLQLLFFPDYPRLPVRLRELEEMIAAVRRSLQPSSQFRDAASQMLSACEQFRHGAFARIQFAETLVSQPAQGGFAHKFSEEIEQLCVQLEYTPQQRKMQDISSQTARLSEAVTIIAQQAAKGGNDVAVVDLLAKIQENQAMLTQAVSQLMSGKGDNADSSTPKIPKVK